MKYISTRGAEEISGAEAIIKGICEDGGLYVPSSFPRLNESDFERFAQMEYKDVAADIIGKYLDDFDKEELSKACESAYARFYGEPAPITEIDDATYVLELWHGPTCAFKDIALTLLPQLLNISKKMMKVETKTLILVATSGDTGKAALEGFRDVDKTAVCVFYPNEGVSKLQQLQMRSQEGSNVFVSAVNGNFDDTQTAVKKIFLDKDIKAELTDKGYELSSANSINFGRLVPQIVYYITSYVKLIEKGAIEYGDKINFCVPSGNFGDILAGYYAYRMGLPINKLICASNKNNILCDFINTGKYDVNREFYKTMSPSMDILVSSNLERLLFELSGRNAEIIRDRMNKLKTEGAYEISKKELLDMQELFAAGWASEGETQAAIANNLEVNGYLIDTHTSVGSVVYGNYVTETGDTTPTVILSTASPYKFTADILKALDVKTTDDLFGAVKKLHSVSGVEIPVPISDLKTKPVRFESVCDKDEMADSVIAFAGRLSDGR